MSFGFGRVKQEKRHTHIKTKPRPNASRSFSRRNQVKSQHFDAFSVRVHALVSCDDMIEWCQAAFLPYLRLQVDTFESYKAVRIPTIQAQHTVYRVTVGVSYVITPPQPGQYILSAQCPERLWTAISRVKGPVDPGSI